MHLIFTLLVLALALVNGWTDAPGAIAGCVCTRSLSPRAALITAAVCNLAGAVIMAALRPGVAEALYGIADFGNEPKAALLSLCCALLSVIIWATVTCFIGLPTSESHALIAALTGAAVATTGSLDSADPEKWCSVLIGLLISTLPVLLFAFFIYKLTAKAFEGQDRRSTMRYFRRVQFISAGSSAFIHGAQDSQKFIGVYLLGLTFLGKHTVGERFTVPLYVTALCACAMTLGTMMGGSRIIKKVGCEMTRLDPLSSSAADTASSAFLGVCSFLGIPTATTHAKTCAMMGVGLCKRSATDPRIVGQMFLGWILTFPICATLGFFLSFIAHKVLL